MWQVLTFCQAELYALIDGQEVKTIVSTSDLSVTKGKVCDQIIVKLVLVVLIVNIMETCLGFFQSSPNC